jgi:hypothetical protein
MKILVSVGINHYKGVGIGKLAGAARDAVMFGAYCEDRLGFDEVRILTDDNLSNGEDIGLTLTEVCSRLGHGDLLVFFLAGHGVLPGPKGQREQAFLLPNSQRISDEQGDSYIGTLKLQELIQLTHKAGLQRLFVFDACRVAPDQFAARLDQSAKGQSPLTILAACHDHRHAAESNDAPRGLFAVSLQNLISSQLAQGKAVVFDRHFDAAIAPHLDQMAARHHLQRAGWQASFCGDELELFTARQAIAAHASASTANVGHGPGQPAPKQANPGWMLAASIVVSALLIAGAYSFSRFAAPVPTMATPQGGKVQITAAPTASTQAPVAPQLAARAAVAPAAASPAAPIIAPTPAPTIAPIPARLPASHAEAPRPKTTEKPGKEEAERLARQTALDNHERVAKSGTQGCLHTSSLQENIGNKGRDDACRVAKGRATGWIRRWKTPEGVAKEWHHYFGETVSECECTYAQCTVRVAYFDQRSQACDGLR